MAWKVTDYNLNTIHNKPEESINNEYDRLKRIVNKRIATFEKHGMSNLPHVKAVKTATQDNNTRRMKERAIMEMKRFTNLEYSSYAADRKGMSKTIAYWKSYGIKGLNTGNVSEFFEFLEWVKSFMGDRYKSTSVAQAWKSANGDYESAKEIFDSMMDDGL